MAERKIVWTLSGMLTGMSALMIGTLCGAQLVGVTLFDTTQAPSKTANFAHVSLVPSIASDSGGTKLAFADTSSAAPSLAANSQMLVLASSQDQTLTRGLRSNSDRGSNPAHRARGVNQPVLITGLAPQDVQVAVARDIQRELARAGCRVTWPSGQWDTVSQAVMRRFLRNMRVALPTQEPNVVLLTMVRGYHGEACGARCGRHANDRCKPPIQARPSTPIVPASGQTPLQNASATSGAPGAAAAGVSQPPRPIVRWAVLPSSAKSRQAPKQSLRTEQAAQPSTPKAAPAKSTQAGKQQPEKSQAGRMALGLPRVSPPANPPMPPDQRQPSSIASPTSQGPYGPGAPRLVPDKPSNVAVTLHAAPAPKIQQPNRRSYRRRRASWKKSVFEVEN